MKSGYLPMFRAPGFSEEVELSFVGERDGDELLDGDILADGAEVGKVRNGILRFAESDNWARKEIKKLRDEDWIRRNWEKEGKLPGGAVSKEFHDKLNSVAASGGCILEVAAGPGGGLMVPVLHRNRDARFIVNDSSAAVLELWQEFFKEHNLGPNVCFAAFDATKMPIRSESMDAVSNQGGFGNVGEGGAEAIREACRVLKPGGGVFSFELVLERDGLEKLPDGMRKRLEKQVIGCGVVGFLEAEGLVVESHHMFGGRQLVAEQDGIAVRAAKHGVTLRATFEFATAGKPVA